MNKLKILKFKYLLIEIRQFNKNDRLMKNKKCLEIKKPLKMFIMFQIVYQTFCHD